MHESEPHKEKIIKTMNDNYPLVVIGAGAGGLVVAIGAAKAGKKVLLIEKGTYGGDCTNFGCIPSKSLIASAEYSQGIREAHKYGIIPASIEMETLESLNRARRIVSEIRSHEEPDALQQKGVETITGTASFENLDTLKIKQNDGSTLFIKAKQIVIAAGSHPAIPAISGLDEVPFLTNETIFGLSETPSNLTILGGGPIGCELAQAFRRLGSEVTIIQRASFLLEKEEIESQELILQIFRQEGISVFLEHEVQKIEKKEEELYVTIQSKSTKEIKKLKTSHFLIAAGRKANLDALDLSRADIKIDHKGIVTDVYGRTSQSHIWALGDIKGSPYFTHLAEHTARCVLFNLLAPWPFRKKQIDLQFLPRVTFTDPEIASVGLLEKEAIDQYGKGAIATYFVPFKDVDRAITNGRTEGFVKIITKKWSSHILGATCACPRGGEMLMEILVAMQHKIPLRKLANVIHPYPTYSLAIRKAADLWLSQTILPFFLNWVKKS